MNLEQAKATIEEALSVAIQKGCFSLQDVKVIVEALQVNNLSVSDVSSVEKK